MLYRFNTKQKNIEVKRMDKQVLGWIQIVGGALALLYPGGGLGFGGMMGMMGFSGASMMGGWAVTLLALLFIVTGIHFVTEKKR